MVSSSAGWSVSGFKIRSQYPFQMRHVVFLTCPQLALPAAKLNKAKQDVLWVCKGRFRVFIHRLLLIFHSVTR